MITPSQVSDSLAVPTSTVRRWAARFEKHLSPRTGKKRTYTPSDLDTFRRIRDLSSEGFGLDRIDEMLAVVERPPDETTALTTLAAYTQLLEDTRNQMQAIAQKFDEQNARIQALEEWINTPFYKRIGKRPPTR